MPGLKLDVAHFDDRLDAAEDEVGLGALVDSRRLLLRPDPGIFERGLVVGTDEFAEEISSGCCSIRLLRAASTQSV